MPFWLASLIVCVPLAFLTTKFKDVKIQLALGYLFFIIASILMVTAKPSSSTQSVIADAIAGAGFAAPLTLLILGKLPFVRTRHHCAKLIPSCYSSSVSRSIVHTTCANRNSYCLDEYIESARRCSSSCNLQCYLHKQ